MSRHRDIRNMDYSEDYDGYDDVYGHSVDDDYYISPSNRQFIYNRENSIGEYVNTQQDIQEEDETVAELSDLDRAKLDSCLEQIKETLGTVQLTRTEVINIVIKECFDVEKSINAILSSPKLDRKVGTQHQPPIAGADGETLMTTATTPRVVAATTTVTKGFDLKAPQQQQQFGQLLKINPGKLTPRSVSPASGRGTPVVSQGGSEVDVDSDSVVRSGSFGSRGKEGGSSQRNVEERYRKERGDGKDSLYMVVIGHVDAGKSTLMGRLLYDLGQVNQKTMHKYEQESRKLGKQSFMYAWVLDETGEERNRGITMDVGRSQFTTSTKAITLLDAPGHKDFIPNMIAGAAQADVALLVVDATRGEFETGFDQGGQTREHALLARSLGVTQLAVAVNKLDTVSWSRDRFDDIVSKLGTFLRQQAGFKDTDVTFVPCSGLTGQNLTQGPTENGLTEWYEGPTLLEVIDKFRTPERPISRPFRLSVNDIFKGTGSGFCVSGRLETGSLSPGDRVMVCPNRELATVKSIFIEDLSQTVIFAGDQATVTLSGIEMQNVTIGNVLCDPQNPVQVASQFEARIVVFNLTVPITKGFSVILHHQSLVEPAVVSKLVSQLNRSTGELVKKNPRFLGKNSSAIVEIRVTRPIALELYSDCKELGRFMLRVGGVTIAAGLITNILS